MSKQVKLMITVLSILGVLILFNIWHFSKKNRVPQTVERSTKSKPRRAARASAAKPEVPTFRYVSFPAIREEWGRDPFVLPIEVEMGRPYGEITIIPEDEPDDDAMREEHLEALSTYRLSGIVRGARPIAIVGERLLREGQDLDGRFTIQSIQRDRVILIADGETYELILPASELNDQRSP